ncbi:MAG TPA: aspartate aminotransferase family protein [Candidatus Limnocylindrales bacterium]|nr:aspartate aminotransferase family protein [Candidatus Limnocylindrales bacterium]
MSKTTDLIARRHAVVPRAVGQFAGAIAVESATGARLVDVDGASWIDFAGGIGVMNVGHCEERVVRAIQEQAARLIHTCIHVATYEPYVALCEKLVELLPHGDATKAVLLNSGAEAVENAVKFARQATGRPALICFTEAFHGRTMMGMSLTSKTRYKVGCGPFAPEIYRLPYPNHFRDGDGLALDDFVERELARLEEAFVNMVPADHVAAVIIEPVLGEGGFIPAPASYLRGLRGICDAHGILLIFDEVQSGFGRTGHWASYEHAGVTPDLSTWAKSMGGGMPISAVLGRAEVMDAAEPGTVGGTYGGNPVACAAALAAIETIEELGLLERGRVIGGKVRKRFDALAERSELVGDVRGLGAMIGLELCHQGDPRRPASEAVTAVTAACRDRGVLVLPAGPHGNVIRVLSPLTIDDDDLERGLAAIDEAVLAVSGELQTA